MHWSADQVRLGLDVFQLLETIAIAIYVWFMTKHKANKEAIDKVDERVDELHDRVLRCESEIAHMPSHDQLSEIHEKINKVSDGLSSLSGEFKAVNSTLNLIHEFLMGKRR